MQPEISVVIPTFNRKESLLRTLHSLGRQQYPPKEILVVDGGTERQGADFFSKEFPALPIRYLVSPPSVCKQRNLGIRSATSPLIFLCDDDIEVPEDYLMQISGYYDLNPYAGIVAGLVLQKNEKGEWVSQYPVRSLFRLLWNFVFQLPFWGDISGVQPNWISRPLFEQLRKYYLKKKNTYTAAGWPLLTNFTNPVTRTSVYGLGASVIRRTLLLEYPFDEILIPSGIGDNYGITVNIPEEMPVHLLTSASVYHHCASENRLDKQVAFRYRTFALHYFMTKSKRFHRGNIAALYWSLFGNAVGEFFRGNSGIAAVSLTTLFTLATGKNPYIQKSKSS